jgi:hypothetical protein
MTLLVIAYPEMAASDLKRIQDYRLLHDETYYRRVGPHFALVFAVYGWDPQTYIREVALRAAGFRQFDFELRSAVVTKDAFSENYQTSLIPDEGLSRFVRLHYQLYRGSLQASRPLNLDFIPSLSVGNSRDAQECLDMVDHWNSNGFSIRGRVCQLAVASFNHETVQTLERLPLAAE